MSNAERVLYDRPGPRAIRRDQILNIVFTLVFVGMVAWFLYGAYQRDIFNDRWKVLWAPSEIRPAGGSTAADVWSSLIITGIGGTLRPVLISIPIVMVLATIITLMRASRPWFLRVPARVITEVFRGIPVLLGIYFGVIVLKLDPLWAVVTGLVVYNMAVVAEILRAGIAALPAGQREAGLAIGLSPMMTVVRIQLPQAVRIMLPALVSQCVVLLKDSSLGFIIAYPELLTILKRNYNYFGEQTVVVFVLVGAVLYILLNMTVSRVAHWLERRMRRSRTSLLAATPEGAEDQPHVPSTVAPGGNISGV